MPLAPPLQTVCRMWDALLHEGPKILFRTALAMMKVYEENILKVDNAGGCALRGSAGQGSGARECTLSSTLSSTHMHDACPPFAMCTCWSAPAHPSSELHAFSARSHSWQ